ncbi:MAG TPA: hypothetical protein VG167_15010 [Verrucomicrobiae bacterium]|nr:hypothetical protein [Verrucomicrobiae bacterium]
MKEYSYPILPIPLWVVKTLFAAVLSMQAWSLLEIVALKQHVAGLEARMEILTGPRNVAALNK